MNISLEGKRALVCGSTSGIGKAIAEEFALLGAEVVLVARNEDKLRAVAAGLNSSGNRKHSFFNADFSNLDEIRIAAENIIKEKGGVNILVNNTGGPAKKLINSFFF